MSSEPSLCIVMARLLHAHASLAFTYGLSLLNLLVDMYQILIVSFFINLIYIFLKYYICTSNTHYNEKNLHNQRRIIIDYFSLKF